MTGYRHPSGDPCTITDCTDRHVPDGYIPEGGVWTREERKGFDSMVLFRHPGGDTCTDPECTDRHEQTFSWQGRAERTVAALLAALKDEHEQTSGVGDSRHEFEPSYCRVCALIAEVEK